MNKIGYLYYKVDSSSHSLTAGIDTNIVKILTLNQTLPSGGYIILGHCDFTNFTSATIFQLQIRYNNNLMSLERFYSSRDLSVNNIVGYVHDLTITFEITLHASCTVNSNYINATLTAAKVI